MVVPCEGAKRFEKNHIAHAAAARWDYARILELCALGAPLEAINSAEQTPLFACVLGFRYFFSARGVFARGLWGYSYVTPLAAAINIDDIPICDLLIQRGANCNATIDRWPLLCYACYWWCCPAVVSLLRPGVDTDVHALSPFGATALHLIANAYVRFHDVSSADKLKSCLSITAMLLDRGFDVNARSLEILYTGTALGYLSNAGLLHSALAGFLISKGGVV